MTIQEIVILGGFLINLIVSITILVTFVATRKNEYKERLRHDILLETSMQTIKQTVEDILRKLNEHQTKLEVLAQDLTLLLQQHHANHGQEIRRST